MFQILELKRNYSSLNLPKVSGYLGIFIENTIRFEIEEDSLSEVEQAGKE